MRVSREKVRVGRGSLLWLTGPARIRVEAGALLVNGALLGEGGELLVQAGRGVSLYAREGDAVVELVVGSGGAWRLYEAGVLVGLAEAWSRLAEALRDEGHRLVLVLGPVESGKSTLSTWLVNSLAGCYASLDPGQNELGTPCYYSMAPVENPITTPHDLRPRWAWLVGCNAPEHCPWQSISAATRLAAYARRRCSHAILDTDGFVAGPGLAHKTSLVEALEPDAIIVVERGPWRELATLSRLYASVYTAPPVPEELTRRRSRAERRAYRERMYRLLFQEARRTSINLAATPLAPPVPPARIPEGLLASLVSREGYETPALLEHYNPTSNELVARVAWEPGEVVGVKLGSTRLVEWREERVNLLAR